MAIKAVGLEYSVEITASAGETFGDWISVDGHRMYKDKARRVRVNTSVSTLMYTLTPNPVGTGRIEVTTDPVQTIKDDITNTTTNTVVVPWPKGDVTVQTQEVSLAVTAFRLVVMSGTVHLSVRGVS